MKNHQNQKDIQAQITEIIGKFKNSQTLTPEELTKFNSFLLAKVKHQQDQITNLTQKNKRLVLSELGKQTENYSLGGILSPPLTYDRPLPPNRGRHNSLPNSLFASRATSPSPLPIYETDYYSDENLDNEEKEAFYITMNAGLERDNAEQKKENISLSRNLTRLETNLATLQRQNEAQDQLLKTEKTTNRQLLKDNQKLQKEKEEINKELKLTNEEYYQRETEIEDLNRKLTEEKKHNKALQEQLEAEWTKSQMAENDYRKLLNQTKKLIGDKKLLTEEKEKLNKSIAKQVEEYQDNWKKREEEHNKLVNNYRVFGVLNKPTLIHKRRTLDFTPTHNRSNSLNSISRRPLNLGFTLTPQTPISPKGNIFADLNNDNTAVNSPLEELKNPFETSLNNIFTEINETIDNIGEMPAETTNKIDDLVIKNEELDKQITDLKNQRKEYISQVGQKDEAVRDLANENIILKNQIRDLELALRQLNQDSLNKYQSETDKLTGQLQEKDWQLSASEIKKLKFHNFTKGLEEVFPLTEPQQKSLKEVGEPDIARLYYLKSNIFRGVNKLKDKVSHLKNETEKQRVDDLTQIESSINQLDNATQRSNNALAQLRNQIEITTNKK